MAGNTQYYGRSWSRKRTSCIRSQNSYCTTQCCAKGWKCLRPRYAMLCGDEGRAVQVWRSAPSAHLVHLAHALDMCRHKKTNRDKSDFINDSELCTTWTVPNSRFVCGCECCATERCSVWYKRCCSMPLRFLPNCGCPEWFPVGNCMLEWMPPVLGDLVQSESHQPVLRMLLVGMSDARGIFQAIEEWSKMCSTTRLDFCGNDVHPYIIARVALVCALVSHSLNADAIFASWCLWWSAELPQCILPLLVEAAGRVSEQSKAWGKQCLDHFYAVDQASFVLLPSSDPALSLVQAWARKWQREHGVFSSKELRRIIGCSNVGQLGLSSSILCALESEPVGVVSNITVADGQGNSWIPYGEGGTVSHVAFYPGLDRNHHDKYYSQTCMGGAEKSCVTAPLYRKTMAHHLSQYMKIIGRLSSRMVLNRSRCVFLTANALDLGQVLRESTFHRIHTANVSHYIGLPGTMLALCPLLSIGGHMNVTPFCGQGWLKEFLAQTCGIELGKLCAIFNVAMRENLEFGRQGVWESVDIKVEGPMDPTLKVWAWATEWAREGMQRLFTSDPLHGDLYAGYRRFFTYNLSTSIILGILIQCMPHDCTGEVAQAFVEVFLTPRGRYHCLQVAILCSLLRARHFSGLLQEHLTDIVISLKEYYKAVSCLFHRRQGSETGPLHQESFWLIRGPAEILRGPSRDLQSPVCRKQAVLSVANKEPCVSRTQGLVPCEHGLVCRGRTVLCIANAKSCNAF